MKCVVAKIVVNSCSRCLNISTNVIEVTSKLTLNSSKRVKIVESSIGILQSLPNTLIVAGQVAISSAD